MDCKYDYEPAINVDCMLHIVAIVRRGELGERSGEVLQHLGTILGELGAWKDSDNVVFASKKYHFDTLEECCDAIEVYAKSPLGSEDARSIPWALIIELVRLLMERFSR